MIKETLFINFFQDLEESEVEASMLLILNQKNPLRPTLLLGPEKASRNLNTSAKKNSTSKTYIEIIK